MAKLTKLTGQQEIFAREFVKCGVASRAYRVAYNVRPTTKPESIWQKASSIMAEAKVQSRIKDLTEKAGARAGVTIESLIVELDQNRLSALETDQAGAANSATMGKAKLTGYLRDDPTKAGDIHIHFDGAIKSLG
jgi:hypothetical protein